MSIKCSGLVCMSVPFPLDAKRSRIVVDAVLLRHWNFVGNKQGERSA